MVVENIIMPECFFLAGEGGGLSLVQLSGWKAIYQSASHRAAEAMSC